jgi:transcription antitermination protein NusB
LVSARTRARKRALDILFEADLRGASALDVLAAHGAARVREGQPPLNEHVAVLVQGVTANRERIDELLSTYAVGWTLDRMPAVDRNLLRIGTYELLWLDDVPDAVAIDEAVELATSLSTDDSPGFVNGLLARLLELKPTLSH